MSVPPTLTAFSLGGGVQSSVMALIGGENAFDRVPDSVTIVPLGMRLDSLDSRQHSVSHYITLDLQCCWSNRLVRKRRMLSYPDGVVPDPLELLTKLQECRDSPYWNRSLSDIGGIVLLKGAEAEIERYDSQTQESQPKEAGS